MNRLRHGMLLTALLGLGGCAVGPDFRPPAAPAPLSYGAQALPAQTEAVAGPAGEAQRFTGDRKSTRLNSSH